MKSLGFCLRVEKTALRIFCAAVALMIGGMALAADEVSFTLTFADRSLPDLRSFTALRACGSAVEYEVKTHLQSDIGSWFMRAIYYHQLPMKFTYAGYAQHHRWYYDWSKVYGTLSADELSERTTEICRAIQKWNLEYQKEYGPKMPEQELFVCSDPTGLPTGSPFPFELPKAKGDCDSEVVWDGVFSDLSAQFGTDEAKRNILEVEVEYDRARRLGFGRIECPIPFLYDAVVASRFTYRAGIGGEVIARLTVKYPGRFIASSCLYYQDPLNFFVLGEWQKAKSRGRTIRGRFKPGDSMHPWLIFVDGESKPVLEGYGKGNCGVRSVPRQRVDIRPGMKRIEPFEFCAREDLSSVTLPEGLESIGNAAFWGCGYLVQIEIPNSVTNLGAWAFRDCDKLQEVKFPVGLREIPDGLFYRYYNFGEFRLERFVVPEGVERIGKYAFYGNKKLGEVRVPKSMKVIDDYAFCNCISLTNVVFEGESRPRIGEGAFRGCEKLKGL